MAYDNKLKGALFVNDNKQSDNHPDYKGSFEDDNGREFWVSAWVKQPRDASKPKFLSLAFTPKDNNSKRDPQAPRPARTDANDFLANNRAKADAHKSPAAPRQPAPDFDSFDDDIPF